MPRYTPTTTTITNRFQVHIPLAIRQQINLEKSRVADIWIEKGIIHIKPKQADFLKLAGILRNKKPKRDIDLDNIRDYIDYSDLP